MYLNICKDSENSGIYQLILNGHCLWCGTLNEINAVVKSMILRKEYNDFIKQFKMVGSNVLFLRNDGYMEIESTGYANIEKNILTHKDSIYRIASIFLSFKLSYKSLLVLEQ